MRASEGGGAAIKWIGLGGGGGAPGRRAAGPAGRRSRPAAVGGRFGRRCGGDGARLN
jgi:hypothetical protein